MKAFPLPLAEVSIVAMLLLGVPALEGMVSIAASLFVGGKSWHVAVQLAKSDGIVVIGSQVDGELNRPVWNEKFADQLAYFEPLTRKLSAAPHADAAGEPASPPAPSLPIPGSPVRCLFEARTAVDPPSTQASAVLRHAL